MKVVVTGAATALGRRVCAAFEKAGITVLAVDGAPSADVAPEPVFSGADAVVHLASSFPPEAASLDEGTRDLDLAARVLDTAASAGVRHALIVSSAMVYGAWPNNPVPLTEDAAIRPNPDFAFAVHLAELERRALDWRAEHSDTSLTVLRPTVTVTDASPGKVGRLLQSVGAIRTDEGDPPAQFLHANDLAHAIVLATEHRVDGVLNVAPDGWISPETFLALASNAPRPRLPKWVAQALASARWRLGLASAPPGLVAYTVYPWVVANDRLRSLGWRPDNTNEEAFVAAHEPGPLDRLNARRRQQIALGVTGGLLAGVVATVIALVVRHRRRARTR